MNSAERRSSAEHRCGTASRIFHSSLHVCIFSSDGVSFQLDTVFSVASTAEEVTAQQVSSGHAPVMGNFVIFSLCIPQKLRHQM